MFEDAHTLSLSNGERVRAKNVLIAVGATPNHGAEIPGIEHVISSNEVFHLEKQPKRILIQGGGYIALEFACIFAGLGTDVTLVYRGDNILRGFDNDVRAHVRKEMEQEGITILTGCTVTPGRQAWRGIHLAALQRLERCERSGDVRHRPASERRQSRAREGGRRHQSEERRHRRRRLLANPRCRTSMRSAT